MSDQAQTRPLRVAKLVWKEGHNAYKEFTMYEGSPTLIGRDKSNHIVLADPMVSKHHAEIDWQDDAFVINDLGSSNGTLVNRTIIFEPTKLEDKSHIEIGIFHLAFQRMEDEAIGLSMDMPVSRLNEMTKLLVGDEGPAHDTVRREDYWKQKMDEKRPSDLLAAMADNDGASSAASNVSKPASGLLAAMADNDGASSAASNVSKPASGLLAALADNDGTAILEEPDWVLSDEKSEPYPAEDAPQDFEINAEMPVHQEDLPAGLGEAVDYLVDAPEDLDVPEETTDPLQVFQVESQPAPEYVPEAPEDMETVEEPHVPSQEMPVPMEYAYAELLMSIETIYEKGQTLRDKWLLILNGIDDTMTQFQKLHLEMADLEHKAEAVDLDELFRKISHDPDNVKLLIELADRSDLLERIIRSYFEQGNKIRKITEDLETALMS